MDILNIKWIKIAQGRIQYRTLVFVVLSLWVLIPERWLIGRVKTLPLKDGDPDFTNSLHILVFPVMAWTELTLWIKWCYVIPFVKEQFFFVFTIIWEQKSLSRGRSEPWCKV
jgi:hypothetical protein